MGVHDPILLVEATRLIPNEPTPNTVWRWCRYGLKLPSGRRIRLPHTQVGGRMFTTAAQVEQFLKDVAQAGSEYFSHDEVEAAQNHAENEPPNEH